MRKLILFALGAIVVAFVAVWVFGRPVYRHYRETRASERARKFFDAKDYRNASVSARQALALNTNNLEACRVMAQLSELSRAPQVLDWRRRVAEISPTVENRLALAAAALRVQNPPFPLASQTLEELATVATNQAGYHVVCAELAMKLNRLAEAENRFEMARTLEPANPLHEFNLSVLRLRSTNEVVAAQARSALENLRGNTNLAPLALRWLVADRIGRKDWPGAEERSRALLALPRPGLEDRLQLLTILREAKKPDLGKELEMLQASVATNAGAIYSLSAWMVASHLEKEALEWILRLPARTQGEQPVPLALVDCRVALKQWTDLEEELQDQKWGDLDFMRLAFLARCSVEQKDELSAESQWRLAIHAAGDRLGPLTSLLNLAGTWGQDAVREELLWQIVQKFPRERWACAELNRLCEKRGDTRALNKLYAAMMNGDSRNLLARNNFAATSMLLQMNLSKAHEIARASYAQHPADPVVASTYAWSLHLQGRTRDGLAVLEKCQAAELENPGVALYYGLLLAAAADTNRANHYLALVKPETLLPEERELVGEALKGR